MQIQNKTKSPLGQQKAERGRFIDVAVEKSFYYSVLLKIFLPGLRPLAAK